MSYWVYVHTCKDNGKRYVGCTTRVKPEYRWQEGRGYKTNKHFYSAILKHGWNNFEHEAWELTSESEMYYAEKYLIAYYHTTESEFGYNHSSGGEKSALGCKHSEETRKKMSLSHKGKSLGEEHRKHLAEANGRKAKDPEFRKRVSETQKKKWSDPEYRERLSKAAKKRASDPEVLRKKSELQKKKWSDPGYRKHMSEARKGKPKPRVKIQLPDGTLVEISKSLLTRWYINKGKKFEYVS